MKGRKEKEIFSRDVYQWERVGTRKEEKRVCMMDKFYIYIQKQKNETY
jgi:hypothetical protein